MMTHYETLLLLPGTLTEEEIQPVKQTIVEVIEKNNGAISLEDNLGKRKLAYPVKKMRHGYYLLFEFDMPKDKINQLDRDIRLTPNIMRHMTVKRQPNTPQPSFAILAEDKPESPTESPSSPTTKLQPPEKTTDKKKEEPVKIENLEETLDELLQSDIDKA